MTASAQARYSGVAMLFHWVIAVLVIINWLAAEAAEDAPREAAMQIMANHKAFGMTILALTIGRLLWRWMHPVPPLPSTYANWERVLARTMHTLFYVLLIALPLGGWLGSSLAGRPIEFFGLFTIPVLPVGDNKDLAGSIFDAHALGGQIVIWLIALHVLAALKHTFLDKDGGIFRMLPFGKVRG